jgi:hypothetical protein
MPLTLKRLTAASVGTTIPEAAYNTEENPPLKGDGCWPSVATFRFVTCAVSGR